ncbi:MAG: hypothetical protein IKM61_08100 [Eubacteriaceae bacterium]|nr:hypothetical protein [Eubacteriaceae bacterium]
MKTFKKVIASVLAFAMVAAVSVGATVAYLQDEDSDVNVMTLGNVTIEQHEYERVVENGEYKTDTTYGYVLKNFSQAKPLYPATDVDANGDPYNYGAGNYGATRVKMSQVDSHGSMDVFVNKNAVDKFVTVENTGKSDAYVRTLIAFEIGSLAEAEFDNIIRTSSFMTTQGVWKVNDIGVVEIDGNKYVVSEYLYNGAKALGGVHENGVLPAGDTTYPSLAQVYMTGSATNEDVEAIDGNKNGTYDILVFSQAVQTAGFENAQTALDTAFGVADATNAKAWFEKDEFEVPVTVATAEELTAALAAGKDVVLTEDIESDSDETITIQAGATSTLDLNGHTLEFVTDDADKNDDGKLTSADNEVAIDVRGTLNVKNGTITINHMSDNFGWNACTEVFYVGFNGTLNIDNAVIENLGGSDMAYAVDVVNSTNTTLNITNSKIKSSYIPVRIFNNGSGMNNVTIKNSTLEGVSRAFWVHIYSDKDNGGKGVKDSTLNLNIFGNGNTFIATKNDKRIIEFGFDDVINFDADGNQITIS